MRLLANENFPLAAVQALRAAGHDTAWVGEDARGSADLSVLNRSVRERRILLTFDKDFGELVFRAGANATCGVVLFRLTIPSPEWIARFVTRTLSSRSDWEGCFSVVEAHQIRMTPLPKRG